MKRKLNQLFFVAAMLCGTMFMTSCQGLIDAVFGESGNSSGNSTKPVTPDDPKTYTKLTKPLTFEAVKPNVTVTFKFKDGALPDYKKVEYSLDGGTTWTALSSQAQPILLKNVGDIVMFRGDNPTYNGDAQFVVEEAAGAGTRLSVDELVFAYISGNLLSLVKKELEEKTATELISEYKDIFKELFKDAKIDVKKSDDGQILLVMPTTLTEGLFIRTFANTLITALNLPATLLQKDCYLEMCLGCEYLKEIIMLAEELPENVTVDDCLKDMLKDAGGKAEGGMTLTVSGDAAGQGSSSGGTTPSGGSALTLTGILDASGADAETGLVFIDDDGKARPVVFPENIYIKDGYETLTLKVGETLDLNEYIVIEPADATAIINWGAGEHPDLIDVTGGVIKAGIAGETNIYATLENWKYYNEENTPQGKNYSVGFTVTIVDDTEEPIAGKIEFAKDAVSQTWSATASNNTYTQTVTKTGDAEVTYSIGINTCGATIDEETGKVTFTKAGSAEVIATVENTESYTYALSSVRYILTVNKAAGSISYTTGTVEKLTTDAAFTNALTKVGDGKVTYKSSKESVAIVDENGKVTIKGSGEAIITATVEDSDTYTYATKTASYTLTVTAAKVPDPTINPSDNYENDGDPLASK